MFLITTADTRTWKYDEKVLFLGEWCRRYSLRAQWQAMDHEVLPYPWDDRARLERDYHYLTGVIEHYLTVLSERLNLIHGTDFPLRYWRIVIGPWLAFFVESLFDRYLSIRMAIDAGATTVWCVGVEKDTWLPRDFAHFNQLFVTDGWCQYIYTYLLGELGGVERSFVDHDSPPASQEKRRSLRRGVNAMLGLYARLIPPKLNRVCLVTSYFPLHSQITLQLRLGQLPYIGVAEVPLPPVGLDDEMRAGLDALPAEWEFERVLGRLLPLQMPIAYLEGYAGLRKNALAAYPRSPQLIYSANAWFGNEAFKMWAAEQAVQGAKLVCAQHGGHFGMGRIARYEHLQVSLSDRFGTWGWKGESGKEDYLPAGKLLSARKHIRPLPRGKVLWVLAAIPRYSYHLYSIPVAGQFNGYLDDQIRFAGALEESIRNDLAIRLHHLDYGWDVADRLADAGLGALLDQETKPFHRALRESRLCISTYNATTYLETLAANFPTMIFWKPAHWELRDSALPFFEVLKEVGIFHTSPESAALFLNRIQDSVEHWWWSTDVQRARRNFVQEFARLDTDWKNQWLAGVKSILNEQSQRHDG